MPRIGEFAMQMAQWVMEGKVKDRVDINDGLENAVTTLGKLFTGGNTGKLLLRVPDRSVAEPLSEPSPLEPSRFRFSLGDWPTGFLRWTRRAPNARAQVP